EMLASLDRLAGLPADTRVCCGHEYTLANADFATSVEPGNAVLQSRMDDARAARARQADLARAAGRRTRGQSVPARRGHRRRPHPLAPGGQALATTRRPVRRAPAGQGSLPSMSTARTGARLSTLAVCALLAACAAEPVKPPPKPAVVIARPESPPTTWAPIAPAIAKGEPWNSLTASFAMPDCADSPLIRTNAAMYTRSPTHFEQRLKSALPLMMYVQKQMQAAGVPGEFAMLPMLESSYNPAEP